MSKKDGSKVLVHQLSNVLPDDRPITAICVVEDIEKCPPNYTVVSRTYDQDTDADLWRESGLFIKKKGRYICFSKTEGSPQCIVEDIIVFNEREVPPQGFSMISVTTDSMQKAWRKKQLCYKLRNKNLCSRAVTDIIICSRVIHKGPYKYAPFGFRPAGEINGVRICFKTIDIPDNSSVCQPYANIESLRSASPASLSSSPPSPLPAVHGSSNGTAHRVAPERPPKPTSKSNGIYPVVSPGSVSAKEGDECNSDRDYEVLSPSARIRPTRPAPQPPKTAPTAANSSTTALYGTLPGSSDLDGVPFLLNPLLVFNGHTAASASLFPAIKLRTRKELDKEYCYDFRAEKET